MYSLASHLQELTWKKEQEKKNSKDRHSNPTPPSTQVPIQEPLVPVGKYLVPMSSLEGEPTSSRCLDSTTGEELSCRVYDLKLYQSKAALFSTGADGVHRTRDILSTANRVFVFSDASYGDLHQYLREKKRLKEMEAASLFRQIVELVKDAHSRGITLRDIKLKKFVFEDARRYSPPYLGNILSGVASFSWWCSHV